MIDIMDAQTMVTIIASIGGAGAVAQWRLRQAEKDNEKQWDFISRMREWQASHVEDSLQKRIDYERRFGDIVNAHGKLEIQYIESEKRTAKIEQKLDHLSGQIEKLMEIMAKK